jgi:hypothetical protein
MVGDHIAVDVTQLRIRTPKITDDAEVIRTPPRQRKLSRRILTGGLIVLHAGNLTIMYHQYITHNTISDHLYITLYIFMIMSISLFIR